MSNLDQFINAYVKIDLYSCNRIPDSEGNLLGKTETMGKNDLWICAMASESKATLLTLDRDFGHLVGKKVEGLSLDIKDYSYLMNS